MTDDDFPEELKDKFNNFFRAIANAKKVLEPLANVNPNSTDLQISTLDRARLNLTSGYALNSLFWMYLITHGIKPSTHDIKHELEHYKEYMKRLTEIAEKRFEPKLDKSAASRLVRGALWEAKEQQQACSSGMQQQEEKAAEPEAKRTTEENETDSNDSESQRPVKKKMVAKDFF